MNITYYGLNINDEEIIYNIDRKVIDQDYLIFEENYG